MVSAKGSPRSIDFSLGLRRGLGSLGDVHQGDSALGGPALVSVADVDLGLGERRVSQEVAAKAVHSADVTQKFVDQFNMEILTTSPEAFAEFQKVEQERWTKVIKDNDIRGD
jgi:hypothetical protein